MTTLRDIPNLDIEKTAKRTWQRLLAPLLATVTTAPIVWFVVGRIAAPAMVSLRVPEVPMLLIFVALLPLSVWLMGRYWFRHFARKYP
jgi:hypothetical protein